MAHSFHNLLIHLIFSTKFRRKCIKPVFKSTLYEYMGGILNQMDCRPLLINGATDHVHVLFGLTPKKALMDVIRDLKSNSSNWVHEKYAHRLFGWQEGYAAFSVSESKKPDVIAYIDKQEEHHRNQSFVDEYIAFLKAHHIPYDERFVVEQIEDAEIIGSDEG